MKINWFRMFGVAVAAFMWFFIAAILGPPWKYIFYLFGAISIVVGVRNAWRTDEHSGDDPLGKS